MTWLTAIKIVGVIIGGVSSLRVASKPSNATKEKRLATILAVLGLGVAVSAELVDNSQKQLAAIEATNRNNALLAEVQRTLHPLFPLRIDVRFLAPLSGDKMQAFRSTLVRKYQRELKENPQPPVAWLHPEDPEFPQSKKDPVAFEIALADLDSIVRLYSSQQTKRGRLDKADVEFCPCPVSHAFPNQVLDNSVVTRWRSRNRVYVFNPEHGLYMSDGDQKIDFVDSKNTTELVSADDLLGATLEIETVPIEPDPDDSPEAIRTRNDGIKFAGVSIVLPGWRRLAIDRQMFTIISPPPSSPESTIYRFVIPGGKAEFDRLIRDEPIWVTAGRP
jgi:hypothetical protein